MDLNTKLGESIDRIRNDDAFLELLKSEPMRAVETLLGMDLSDEDLNAIIVEIRNIIASNGTKNLLNSLKQLF